MNKCVLVYLTLCCAIVLAIAGYFTSVVVDANVPCEIGCVALLVFLGHVIAISSIGFLGGLFGLIFGGGIARRHSQLDAITGRLTPEHVPE